MALSEKSRSAAYEGLTEAVGEEAAAEMLAYFPARDVDEPVTREFLRAEMSDLAGDLRAEMSDLRGELRAEMSDLRGELRAEMSDLQVGMSDLRGAMERGFRLQTVSMVGVVTAAVGFFTVLERLT